MVAPAGALRTVRVVCSPGVKRVKSVELRLASEPSWLETSGVSGFSVSSGVSGSSVSSGVSGSSGSATSKSQWMAQRSVMLPQVTMISA